MKPFGLTTFRYVGLACIKAGLAVSMVAVLVYALALVMPGSAEAQTSEWEQRTACMSDALRLCSSDIPDRQKIMTCMAARHEQLTPRCAVVFDANMRALQQQRQ